MVFLGLRDNIARYRIITGIKARMPMNGPFSVHLDLTNRCNNDCISCWSFSQLVGFNTMSIEQRKKELSHTLVKKLIDDLASMGTREIYLTGGGDPSMHPRFIQIIEYVKKKRMRIDMSTNFTVLDKKKIERIVRCKADHMNCSLWAGTPQAYERTHPNKTAKDFENIRKSLLYFKKIKNKHPKITLYNVISNRNHDDFENMVEFAFKVKADAINFTPTDIVPGYTDSLMLEKKEQNDLINMAKGIWDKIRVWEKKYSHKVEFREYETFLRRISSSSSKNGIYDLDMVGKIPCYAGYTFLRILADGTVHSCLKSGRIPIGNIHKRSIKHIWKNKRQEEFRKHTIDYDLDDPYFHQIGNTTQEGNGCLYCCDNLGWNQVFHEEMERFS